MDCKRAHNNYISAFGGADNSGAPVSLFCDFSMVTTPNLCEPGINLIAPFFSEQSSKCTRS